ncbi:MAG: M3 family oligoendopeptidase [Alphaproteobacteria bacterium]
MSAVQASDLGDLPEWDLGALYAGIDDPKFAADFTGAAQAAKTFAQTYQGKLAGLDGAAFGAAISAYEQLEEQLGRILSFASLVYVTRMDDPDLAGFQANAQARASEIASVLVFFTLEINRIDDAHLAILLKDPATVRYQPWIEDLRIYRPHELSDELEKLLVEKSVTGRAAWGRLFDETVAGLRFTVRGKELTEEETLHLLSEPDADVRADAAVALADVFGRNIKLFALITNTLAKDKDIEDRWRHYPEPATARHLSNRVEPEVVAALVSAVRDAYPQLSHRYYALKARWLGKDKLAFWDRNAPLPDQSDRRIGWEEARTTVLSAYADFAPEMAQIGQQFFDGRWIHAPTVAGKIGGAFSHSTVPSAHPFVLMNYQGKLRDVMTLAHELGHGVHQVLAAGQGALMADTPLTLAETASVFGEMLTFQALLKTARSPAERRGMLASKVEDMLNTVVRQIAFYEFERRAHDARKQGELTPEQLGEIWLGVQRESLGPSIDLSAGYENFWCYIPHFIHSPFYVYAYAFGDCLVNSLFAVYSRAASGFQEKYFTMLRAGGSKRYGELLAPFGLDASDPAFWRGGLSMISGFIDELEAGSA